MTLKFQPNVDGSATILVGTTPAIEISSTGKISLPINEGEGSIALSTTAKLISNIPSGVRRIELIVDGLSLSGTNYPSFRLGDVTSVKNSGYLCLANNSTTASTGASIAHTSGINISAANAGNVLTGILYLENIPGTNKWIGHGHFISTGGAADFTAVTTGVITLSSELTQIEITSVNKSDTFDAGTVHYRWWK